MAFRSDPRNGLDALAAAQRAGFHAVFCVTTNCRWRRNGTAIMGAGIALQTALRFPGIDAEYGELLRRGEFFARIGDLIMFPTKHAPEDRFSDLALIEASARRLLELVLRSDGSPGAIEFVVLPPAGCGNGGLNWYGVVRPLLEAVLAPIADRVIFVHEPRSRA